MKTTHLLTVLGLALATIAMAAERTAKPSTYVDGTYGFSLNTPRFPLIEKKPVTVFQAFAPPKNNFEANLNAQVQLMNMDRAQYRALSTRQFKKSGWKINSDKDATVSGHDAILWDFEGMDDGIEYRWLALAVIDKPRVFLVTCVALKKDFEASEKEFRASLDSFRLAE